MNFGLQDFGSILPILVIVGSALLVIVLDLFLDDSRKYLNSLIAFAAMGASVIMLYLVRDYNVITFNGVFVMDMMSIYFGILFCLIGGITVLLSINYLKIENINQGEYYALVLIATAGMMIIAGSANLIIMFLGIETMSIPIYILAGYRRKNAKSVESALKYFLMGAFAAGFLLYGMALVYAATGSLDIAVIAQAKPVDAKLYLAGIGLIVVGLGFKVSAVPFHMWTPDVYEGAPTPITAFMSAGVKAAGFAAFIRLFHIAFAGFVYDWSGVFYAMSLITMTVGNIVAIKQTNIKRMLAYSSIAHAGYILAAFAPATKEAMAGVLYYLVAYAIMNLGAFGCIILTAWKGHEGDELKDYRGMGWEKPVMGIALTIFMLSLAGIPPTVGFLGKFYVFSAIIKAKFYWLAVLGILNSVLAVYYYLRVVLVLYMEPKPDDVTVHPDDTSIFARGPFIAASIVATAVLTIVIGIWPQYFYSAAVRTMEYILPMLPNI